jgi:hypothetical protein
LRQNVPIFEDGLSVPENKTLHNFFRQNVPDPQKTFTATAPLLLSWQPGPGARPRRRGPGGPVPSGTAKNDAALALTISASAIRLHTKFGAFGPFCEQNLGTDLSVYVMFVRQILLFKSVQYSVLSKRTKRP